jgi:hypothetical protein
MASNRIVGEKRCNCKGTSSGPRLVIDIPNSQVIYTPFACDVCDKSWDMKIYSARDEK